MFEFEANYHWTIDKEKKRRSFTDRLLVYNNISNNIAKPEPERLRPLCEMPIP